MNEDSVLSYLTDIESMEVPNAIEEVNAKVLQNIIDETEFVAVVFYGKILLGFLFLFISFSKKFSFTVNSTLNYWTIFLKIYVNDKLHH